ncbi:MAG: PqqD family protein [Bacteriovoracaceae bacterium]|nr:PqqD family protein [Bacteriovoracaceae bacterium]
MSTNILDKTVKVQSDLVARNNDDGTIVVMKMDESNLFFKIEGIAAEVWKGLNQNKNLKQIHADIKSTYDVEDTQLLGDIENFINDLKSRDLVQIS